MGRVSWVPDAVHQGATTLRRQWSFLPESFPTESFAVTQGGRHTPLCGRGVGGDRLTACPSRGVGTHVSPGRYFFSSGANLCPLPGGSWGQEITEFPSLSFFPPVFFQPHSHSMPFSRAVSTSWAFHLPRLCRPSLLSRPLPQRLSFPVDLMKALEALGPSCPPAQ